MEDLYPTRRNEEVIIDRREPVVYGAPDSHNSNALSADQLATYESDGFIIIPNVFSAHEVDFMVREYETLAFNHDLQGREELVFEPESNELRSIFNPQRFSPLFDRISRDQRIKDKAQQILDSDVYIHQARINIKRGIHGKSFPWHSDFETWHAEDGLPRMRVLTAWIMLTENTPFNGPLFLVPGSHKQFVGCVGETPKEHHKASLRQQKYGVPSLNALNSLMDSDKLAGAFGKPGTLVFHEGNVMHGSPDNITPWPRTNLFFVYNSIHNTPASKPFAAPDFRPEFLASQNFTPLREVD